MELTKDQVKRSDVTGFMGYLDIAVGSPVHARLMEARNLMRKGRELDPENFDEAWMWCNKAHLEWLCQGPMQHASEEEWVRVLARDTAIYLLQCLDENLDPVAIMYEMAKEQGWRANVFTIAWADDQRKMVELLNDLGDTEEP